MVNKIKTIGMGKGFLKTVFLVSLVIVIAISIKFYYFLNTSVSDSQKEIIFEIPPGYGLNAISKRLETMNLVKDADLLRLYVYFSGGVKLFKVGEYALKPSHTPIEIYSILISGRSILYNLTIPEGYNIYQIASVMREKGLGNPGEFLKLVKDPAVISEFNLRGRSLEGYLFPSTYKFARSVPTMTIIKTMVDKFNQIYDESFRKRAREMGFTDKQIITLASIVEKETGNPSERATISSVFHNRLKKRMRLESDPTVIYGIENFNGNLTRTDLQKMTPYNTYRIFGLPEGPIANPRQAAIRAVLWPENTKYLFFVSKNDGTHIFTKNFRDHTRAVNKYQKIRKNRIGKSWRDLRKKTNHREGP